MAKKNTKSNAAQKRLKEVLRRYIRANGNKLLEDPNITSVGVGRKNGKGDLCLVFTVGEKAEISAIESLGSNEIPSSVSIEGLIILTDVVQRSYVALSCPPITDPRFF